MSRQCPFCGWLVDEDALSCYHCRETLPGKVVAHSRNPAAGHTEIRRGLLYALLAGVIHYAAMRAAEMDLPVQVPTAITEYLTPLLFVAGIGLLFYGWVLRLRG